MSNYKKFVVVDAKKIEDSPTWQIEEWLNDNYHAGYEMIYFSRKMIIFKKKNGFLPEINEKDEISENVPA